MFPTLRALALFVALVPFPAFARAARWGGLDAVAVSPDGKVVVTGGQSRVLFVHDGADFTVQKRVWVGARIGRLSFSRDGTRLLVEDDSEVVQLFDTRDWKALAKVERVRGAVVAANADLAVVRALHSSAGATLRFLSLSDGSIRGVMDLKERVAAYTLDLEGKHLVILTQGHEGDEKRDPPGETPRDLEGLDRWEYKLRRDGMVADLRVYEVATGKVVREQKLWYTSDSESTRLFVVGDVTLVTNFHNTCARITADGTTTLFATGVVFNYSVELSADGKVLVAGGLREGTWGEPGGKGKRFTLPALPGEDEFVSGVQVRPDGSAYLVTTAYRLVRLSKEGRVEKVAPVY